MEIQQHSTLTGHKMPKLNCDSGIYDADRKDRERCPECGQFHLRAGYCQALGPKVMGLEQWRKRMGRVPISSPSVPIRDDLVPVTLPEPEIVPVRNCVECGTEFEAARQRRYCSDKCRKRAQR